MNLEFQIYDYSEDHELLDDDDFNNKYKSLGDYIIHVFGRTADDKSVYAKIMGFTPYFYIRLPNEWDNSSVGEIKIKLGILEEWLKSRENTKLWSQYKQSLLRIDYIKSKKAEGFIYDFDKNEIKKFNFARLVFNNSESMKKYSYFFEKNPIPVLYNFSKKPIIFKLYESNFLPMLRCFHIKKISGCSWISIDNENYRKIKKLKKESYCDIEISVNWEYLNPIKKDFNAPFKIASFDIEVFSHDGQFPQAHRELDQIIQIGVTYTRLGESTPYRKWISCLKETNIVNDVDLVHFENEDELINAFIDEIRKYDCDIITGYNIFGFDEKYIYDRCEKILNMKSEVAFLSKLKNKCCNFKECKLSSSALNENILNFWETPGRVHIDLLKEVQKTYNLSNYKLDFVASNFIRGEIKSYNLLDNNQFVLECLSVNDIRIGDYIYIEIMKGFISDYVGDKYFVTDIDVNNKKIYVNSDSFLEELKMSKADNTIFWSQAKDNVTPDDIFKFQKDNPEKRAIIAKYCVKDCTLVNLLMNKLEIVTKNIEMANVCFIPLNYLFIRGQGIKIFSLCLKEFREQGYIFPVKKYIENTQKDESYEGAIVIDPEPQIDYEAIAGLDYGSLYPSCAIGNNTSPETEIVDIDNDNINNENIKYFSSSFYDNSGDIKNIRFVKINDKLGVIPSILDNLLKERKIIKGIQKKENDPFKWKILEAKQLAVKITANSLYGQLGASTSPIVSKNIAACITASGREMLLFAKKYVEELLPWIINGLKEANKNKNEDVINFIVNKEVKNKNSKFIDKLNYYCSNIIDNYTIQPVVRYGDSVTSYTPIYIKVNNQIEIVTIEELGYKYGNNNWLSFDNINKKDKEFCELYNIESWSDIGWTKIYRVIRHKLCSNKKIMRIRTNHSLVDVTDDHSLLSYNKQIISPKNLTINSYLCHNLLDKLAINNKINHIDNIEFENMIDNIEFENMIDAACYINYLNSIKYYKYNIFYRNNIIIINCVDVQDSCKLRSIEEISYSGYVYDLTTENNHFAAGVGNLIVHNTDSVFTCFRFKEKHSELDYNDSLILFKEIVDFGEELIKPFFLPDEQQLFSIYYKKYYSNINDLILPKCPNCISKSNNNRIILPVEERIKQFLKEYLYENYLSWLWTLQEIINKSYKNINIKLFDHAEYLLSKYKFTYNNLFDRRKDEIIIPLDIKIKSFYNLDVDNNIIWSKSSVNQIDSIVILIKELFTNELYKDDKEIYKIVKIFLDVTLLEEWICTEKFHDVLLTKEKKKLKRERKYNDKYLTELLTIFVETKLKCNFNKHKNNHQNKVINFITTTLKEYIIEPLWDVVDDNIIYKIKIYNKSEPIIDKRTLDFSIVLGDLTGELVKSRLPFPHDLEYEKTFWPFLILTKKRYVGNKYEFDSNKFKQDYMGIVLKRRDNAPIVKEICSGIIDYLINKKDPEGAKKFTEQVLENMFEGKYNIKYFLQSRTLKSKESYVDWTKIAHVYLAEKIAKREGSKPESGNRIEYAVVCVPENEKKERMLQGDMIETPEYINKNNLSINYIFYMKNQIMNPVLQFLSLVDKDADKIFKKFEEKYGNIKPKKEKSKIKVTEDDLSLKKIIKNKKMTEDDLSLKKISKKKITEDDLSLKKISKKKVTEDDLSLKKISKKKVTEDDLSLKKISKKKVTEDDLSLKKISKKKVTEDDLSLKKIIKKKIEISIKLIEESDIKLDELYIELADKSKKQIKKSKKSIIEPVAETIIEPTAETIIEPTAETIIEPTAETIIEPTAETIIEPTAETIIEPTAESIIEPEAETIIEPEAETIIEPEAETIIEPEVETIIEPEVETIIEPEVETIIEPEVETIIEPVKQKKNKKIYKTKEYIEEI